MNSIECNLYECLRSKWLLKHTTAFTMPSITSYRIFLHPNACYWMLLVRRAMIHFHTPLNNFECYCPPLFAAPYYIFNRNIVALVTGIIIIKLYCVRQGIRIRGVSLLQCYWTLFVSHCSSAAVVNGRSCWRCYYVAYCDQRGISCRSLIYWHDDTRSLTSRTHIECN